MQSNRRNFLRQSIASAAGMAAISMLPDEALGRSFYNNTTPVEIILKPDDRPVLKKQIKFSIIGINHNHIYGIANALIKGGGELVAVYSREPELLPAFTKAYPNVKVAK